MLHCAVYIVNYKKTFTLLCTAFVAPSRGDIRLVGVSSSDDEGLVEIYYPRRAYQWSTVCTNDWDDTEAKIVCKQLGYQTGRSKFYR